MGTWGKQRRGQEMKGNGELVLADTTWIDKVGQWLFIQCHIELLFNTGRNDINEMKGWRHQLPGLIDLLSLCTGATLIMVHGLLCESHTDCLSPCQCNTQPQAPANGAK